MKQEIAGKNDYILAEETKRFPNLHFGVIPALIVVILPKCPLCLMAYASILGTFGLTPLLYSFWILPVTIFFSSLTIILLYYRAKRSGKYLPFLLSLTAPFMIFTGKFYLESSRLVFTGAVVLLSSSIWFSVSEKQQSKCSDCSQRR